MTKAKAARLAQELSVKCDEPFLFAVRVGTGTHFACKSSKNGLTLATMFLGLLETVFEKLEGDDLQTFKEMMSGIFAEVVE